MRLKKNKNYVFEEDLYKAKKVALFNNADYVDPLEQFNNPFLTEEDKDFSIEDYPTNFKEGISKKSNQVYLGSVIRNQFIPKRKRFKAFKKTLNKYKKDYYAKLDSDISEKENEQFIYDSILVKKISKGYKNTLFIIFIVNLIITVICKLFFKEQFNDFWFSFLNYGLYFLIIVFLGYVFIYKKRNSSINAIQERQLKIINKHFKKEKKHFKKFYNKLYKYYRSNIFSESLYYPSILFSEFWDYKYNYSKVLESKENIQRINIQLVKNQKIFQMISGIILLLSIINIIALLIVIVMKLI